MQSQPSGYFVYDYFLKDHLSNIRSVVTDEKDTAFYPAASFETAQLANEKLFYDSLDNGRVAKPGSYPADGYTDPNDFVQKLSSSSTGKKTGAAILLKVMAGDRITVRATGWYNSVATPSTPASPLTDIVNSLIATVPGAGGAKFAGSQLSSTVLNPGVTDFLSTRDASNNSARPKAYLNVVLFDEQLNPVLTTDGKNSYFQQVGASGTLSPLGNTEREITKSGYVYIYVSNETPNIDVYFDNLQVTHLKGQLLQEEGYYPFGLEMKAISSQAATKMQTRYKFNAGSELEDNFDVNYYETSFRQYDAQIGRFTGIDALAVRYVAMTPYQFGNNNPASLNDPTGLFASWGSASGIENATTGYKMFRGLDYGLKRFEAKMAQYHQDILDAQQAAIDDIESGGDGSGGGFAKATGSGFQFHGDADVSSFFNGFLEAYNHPNDDGNWNFTLESQQFDVYDKEGIKMGYVERVNYETISFTNEFGRINKGATLSLAFHYLTDYEGPRTQKWNWVQTVTTDNPYFDRAPANTPYYDPFREGNEFHYFYEDEMISFGDRSSRDIKDNTTWRAVLSLVDMNDKRAYISFSWGWTYTNGELKQLDLTEVSNPSF